MSRRFTRVDNHYCRRGGSVSRDPLYAAIYLHEYIRPQLPDGGVIHCLNGSMQLLGLKAEDGQLKYTYKDQASGKCC
jgi:hypothetical protein